MNWKYTIKLRAVSLIKVPLIAFISPVVEHLDDSQCIIRIPFGWRVKNLLGSMFFGAMTTAADAAYGLLNFKILECRKDRVHSIVKEFQVSFTKRVEADAWFHCLEGKKIQALIDKAVSTGERVEDWIEVTATVPSKFQNEPVAVCRLLISAKSAAKK